MRVVFCGTPEFAVPTLRALIAGGFDIPLVVSQPDRPRGRGLQIAPTPVKQVALDAGLEITQPEKIRNNPEFQARLQAAHPDAIVVVAYGRIIPQWMLDLPPLGNINLHASLLPKYRGAAPIQWAIAEGEAITGNTTMLLDAGLDTGAILLQQEIAIEPEDTAVTLAPRLAQSGAKLMVETLRGLASRTITPVPQDHSRATLAPILKKEDGLIDCSRTAQQIADRLRGFQPWPGAYITFRGRNLSVIRARALTESPLNPTMGPTAVAGDLSPRELRAEGGRLLLGCGGGTVLEVFELQPEGKRAMSAREFINGYRLQVSEFVGA